MGRIIETERCVETRITQIWTVSLPTPNKNKRSSWEGASPTAGVRKSHSPGAGESGLGRSDGGEKFDASEGIRVEGPAVGES